MAAIRRNVSLKYLVTHALEHELENRRPKLAAGVLDLPLIASRKPGTRRLSPDDVSAILIREEQAVYEAAERR